MNKLQKAQEAMKYSGRRSRTPINKEDIDLALAWVRDEVSLTAVGTAYGLKPRNLNAAYIRLSKALKAHLKK